MKAINPNANVRGNAEQLCGRASLMGLTVKKVEQNVIESWVGKPKGMKQVAFKKDFVEEEMLLQKNTRSMGASCGMI
eukprot:12151045-Ditylum_brightwellii.AAC.1